MTEDLTQEDWRQAQSEGKQLLERLVSLLCRQIEERLPDAELISESSPWQWSLDGADLTISSYDYIGYAFPHIPNWQYHVVGFSSIAVHPMATSINARTTRAHSLWYCRSKVPDDVFQWYEIGFTDIRDPGRPSPIAVHPEHYPFAALSETPGDYRIHYPLTLVSEKKFIEEWLQRFTQGHI